MRLTQLAAMSFIAFILSCNNNNDEGKIVVVEPAENENDLTAVDNDIAQANQKILNDSTAALYGQTAGAPSTWASFESFFKQCVQSSTLPNKSLFSKYKLLYLGPTNPRYLGAIYSKDGVVPQAELTKYVTQAQLDTLVTPGVPVASCDINQIKDLFVTLAIGNLPYVTKDTNVKFVLDHKETIANSVGTWTVDGIDVAAFKNWLDQNASDPNLQFYRNTLVSKGNLFSFQVVKVSGFQADINLDQDLKADLDADIPLVKASTGSNPSSFAFKFHKTANRTVHIQSSGDFYAFALVMKGKKV